MQSASVIWRTFTDWHLFQVTPWISGWTAGERSDSDADAEGYKDVDGRRALASRRREVWRAKARRWGVNGRTEARVINHLGDDVMKVFRVE
jgi:hypothetical protein